MNQTKQVIKDTVFGVNVMCISHDPDRARTWVDRFKRSAKKYGMHRLMLTHNKVAMIQDDQLHINITIGINTFASTFDTHSITLAREVIQFLESIVANLVPANTETKTFKRLIAKAVFKELPTILLTQGPNKDLELLVTKHSDPVINIDIDSKHRRR